MKRLLVILGALALSLGVSAQVLVLNGQPLVTSAGVLTPGSSSPFSLPLLTASQAQSMLTFLGSITIPNGETTGFYDGVNAIYVSGSTMYAAGLQYNPSDTGMYSAGVGELTLPTLTGAPDYTGGNGTATVASGCSYTPTGTCVPWTPTAYVPAVDYTFTTAPVSGSTSGTLTSTPTGVTANAGWYVQFNNSAYDYYEITGVSGNTITWGSALPSIAGEKVGTGDGSTVTFSHTAAHLPVVPSSVTVTAGSITATDNGSGTLTGTGIASGTINYTTGAVSITYSTAPTNGTAIKMNYGYQYSTTTSANIFQWAPSAPFGQASGWKVGGILVSGGNIYINGGTYYDGSCNQQLGWIVETSASTPGNGWGTVNTVQGQTAQETRGYFGPMNLVPSVWQPYFGDAFETGGHALSIDGCYVPTGFTFNSFNPANVSSGGGAVPVSTALNYPYTGGYSDIYAQQLNQRSAIADPPASWSFSGPFPTCTQTNACSPSPSGYPATLTSALSAGATTATISLPTASVTVTANATDGSNTLTVTAVTSGTISDSGIPYDTSDASGDLNGLYIQPAFDYSPGTSLGTGSYNLSDSTFTSPPTGDTVTLTPGTYSGWWRITFSDGETRIVRLGGSAGTVPYAVSGSLDPTTFTALTGNVTANITLAPVGDNYVSTYDNPYGGGFIVPGTSTFVAIQTHNNGVERGRGTYNFCYTSASGSTGIPLAPDTKYYISPQIVLYRLSDLYSSIQGSTPVYQPSPYALATIPGATNWATSQGCYPQGSGTPGWVALDQSDDILYIAELNPANDSESLVFEYQLTPP